MEVENFSEFAMCHWTGTEGESFANELHFKRTCVAKDRLRCCV